MRVLVTGSRDWPYPERVTDALNHVGDVTEVVHGGCPTGADEMAMQWCLRHKVSMRIFPARWAEHGRAAGPIRNQQMVNAGADICLAFIWGGSKGASGTADMAEAAGIRTIRITS